MIFRSVFRGWVSNVCFFVGDVASFCGILKSGNCDDSCPVSSAAGSSRVAVVHHRGKRFECHHVSARLVGALSQVKCSVLFFYFADVSISRMESLLGVVLVVQFPSQQPETIYQYPSESPRVANDKESNEAPAQECFGIPSVIFASMMLPEDYLCNRPFYLEIDAGTDGNIPPSRSREA